MTRLSKQFEMKTNHVRHKLKRGDASIAERDCAESQSQHVEMTGPLRLVFDTAALR